MDQSENPLSYAHLIMVKALDALRLEAKSQPSRANSIAQTELETAMMWNNKDRADKGQLKGSDTHVPPTTY
jgi:hypothetical protein